MTLLLFIKDNALDISAFVISIISLCISLGWFQTYWLSKNIKVTLDVFERLFEDASVLNIDFANFADRDILLWIHSGYVYKQGKEIKIVEQYLTLKANSVNHLALQTETVFETKHKGVDRLVLWYGKGRYIKFPWVTRKFEENARTIPDIKPTKNVPTTHLFRIKQNVKCSDTTLIEQYVTEDLSINHYFSVQSVKCDERPNGWINVDIKVQNNIPQSLFSISANIKGIKGTPRSYPSMQKNRDNYIIDFNSIEILDLEEYCDE